jgi:lipid-binding SYLF domain-containing protein
MLVMNDGGMKHLLSDKFTIGAEASGAAGPVGRDATAQTDAVLHAEILSYSRSRGIFGGLTLDGATLMPDKDSDHALYGHDVTNKEILTGDMKAPPEAMNLEHALNRESARKS